MTRETNIPAQGLGPALELLAREFDVQIVFVSEDIDQLRTQGAVGKFTPEQALNFPNYYCLASWIANGTRVPSFMGQTHRLPDVGDEWADKHLAAQNERLRSRLDASGLAVLASSSSAELSQESDQLRSGYFTHHLLVSLRGPRVPRRAVQLVLGGEDDRWNHWLQGAGPPGIDFRLFSRSQFSAASDPPGRMPRSE